MDEMDDLYAERAHWQSRRRAARVALQAWAGHAPREVGRRLQRAIADADAALAFIRAQIDYLEEGRALSAAAQERADYWRSVL